MLSLQNSKTFSSCKEDRKGEEDYNDYPANFDVMQGCSCVCEPKCISKFEQRQWALTVGHQFLHNNWTHFAAVSSAHKAGCLHNHTSVVPAAKTRAQSAPATCSLLHTKSISFSHQIDCYLAVPRPDGKKQRRTPNTRLRNYCCVDALHILVSLPRMKQLPDLLWSPATVRPRIPMRGHREPRPYMYINMRCQDSHNTAQPSHQVCASLEATQ